MRAGAVACVAVLIGCASPRARVVVDPPPAPPPAVIAAPVAEPFPEVGPTRLPHTFEPARYRARLTLDDHRFGGHVEIDGELRDEVSLIWLHGSGLVVTRATATRDGTTVPLEASPPRRDQLVGLRASTPVPAGQWTLALDYTGPVRDAEPPVDGVDPFASGVVRRVVDGARYLYTQGEPTGARRIFPCVDEPDRKVPWQLTLDVATGLVAASNTTIVRQTELPAARTRVEFAETRPLPSYLIAFAVGPFDVVDAPRSQAGTPIRVLALRGHGAAVATSAALAPRVLDAFEAWLAIPYPYGKLDLVAMPHAGFAAMENPGLVTFTDDLLERDHALSIISHELAHQWFGNLVTLASWDDLWLNESFAAFASAKIDARLAAGATADDVVAERLDALPNLARDDQIVGTGGDWTAGSPGISRGAALLALVEAALGPDRFVAAVRAYLGAHAHGNATTADLLHAFGVAASRPIEPPLTAMLAAPIPVLATTERCDGPPRLHVADLGGPVPVCAAYDRDGKRAEACAVVDPQAPDLPLPARGCPRWVMPNAGGVGPYRVRWWKANVAELLDRGWRALTLPEKETVFGEVDDDALKLAIFVRLALDGDVHATPRLAEYLARIARYVPRDLRPQFDAWVLARYGAQARARHLEVRADDGLRVRDQRTRELELVALARDPQLVAEAAQRVAHDRELSRDTWLASPILTLAASADPRVVEALFADLAGHDDTRWRRLRALDALSRVRDLVGLLAADPRRLAKLSGPEGMHAFANVCDRADRDALAALLDADQRRTFHGTLLAIDRCIATRATLEPDLRRWLVHAK